jgi:glutamate--cysteine ligase
VVDRKFERRLAGLINSGEKGVLRGGRKGVEKESLRVSPDGDIVQSRHPTALGAPLTNENITTDFSESLIELVTPPFGETWELLQYLCDIHQFVYRHLDDELLWATSMPCALIGRRQHSTGAIRLLERRTHEDHLSAWSGSALRPHHAGDLRRAFQLLVFTAAVGRSRGHQRVQTDAAGFHVRAVLRRAAQLSSLRLAGAVPVRHIARRVEELSSRAAKPPCPGSTGTPFYEPFGTSLRMSDIGYRNKNQADRERVGQQPG